MEDKSDKSPQAGQTAEQVKSATDCAASDNSNPNKSSDTQQDKSEGSQAQLAERSTKDDDGRLAQQSSDNSQNTFP